MRQVLQNDRTYEIEGAACSLPLQFMHRGQNLGALTPRSKHAILGVYDCSCNRVARQLMPQGQKTL